MNKKVMRILLAVTIVAMLAAFGLSATATNDEPATDVEYYGDVEPVIVPDTDDGIDAIMGDLNEDWNDDVEWDGNEYWGDADRNPLARGDVYEDIEPIDDDLNENDENGGLSPLVIVAIVAAVVLLLIIIIAATRKKK